MTRVKGVFFEKGRRSIVGILLGVVGLDRDGQTAGFFGTREEVRVKGKAVQREVAQGSRIFRIIGCEHTCGGGAGDARFVCVNEGDGGSATMKFKREGETDNACT